MVSFKLSDNDDNNNSKKNINNNDRSMQSFFRRLFTENILSDIRHNII